MHDSLMFGASSWIRTKDLSLIERMLLTAELTRQYFVAERAGFEPAFKDSESLVLPARRSLINSGASNRD